MVAKLNEGVPLVGDSGVRISGKREKFAQYGVNYKAEIRANTMVLSAATEQFKAFCKQTLNNQLPINFDNFEETYFVRHRLKEILVAATDDIVRHCVYHSISKDKTHPDLFALAPPTRAAFLVKWITAFKPCTLDSLLSKEESQQLTTPSLRYLEYSNEFFSIMVASTVMGLKNKNGNACLLSTLIAPIELESFLYQLKYRINHQDTLFCFFNRLFWDNPASDLLKKKLEKGNR